MLFCFIPENKRRYRPFCSGSGVMASFSLLPRETLMQELISSQFWPPEPSVIIAALKFRAKNRSAACAYSPCDLESRKLKEPGSEERECKAIDTSNIYLKPATPGTQELSSAEADYACSQSRAWLDVVGPKARGRGSGERVQLSAPKRKQWKARESITPLCSELQAASSYGSGTIPLAGLAVPGSMNTSRHFGGSPARGYK